MPPLQVRTVRHRSEQGEWRMDHGAVHPSLRPHVRGYTGYVERTAFARRREVPSDTVPLIVNLGRPLRLVDPDRPERSSVQPVGFLSGLWDSVAITDSAGESSGLQVNLSPVGARMAVGLPMGELVNRVVSLEDLLGPRAALLAERLAAAPTWPARFAIMDGVLAGRFARAPGVPPDLVWAWRRLRETSGALGVRELAAELGCSRKHLSARFRSEIGLPPKTMARVLRFRSALALMNQGGPGLAEIAHRCGYYDQAHLNRDFREFAGCSPTEHLRRTLPDGGGVLGD